MKPKLYYKDGEWHCVVGINIYSAQSAQWAYARSKLVPCSICKANPLVNIEDGFYNVYCNTDGCHYEQYSGELFRSLTKAINYWNNRQSLSFELEEQINSWEYNEDK